MQLANFIPPMDDELSDEAGVGVSSREGSIKRKEKRDLAQRVEQTPLDPCFDLTHKKKIHRSLCAREF